ncbi:MAG: alpha/beta hydrolase [Candidatus Velthaea sp.]
MARIGDDWRDLTPLSRDASGLAHAVFGVGPPVLFLHGTAMDYRIWHPIVKRLQDHCSCIVVDLPGHGSSDGCHRYDYLMIADQLERTVSCRGFTDPVVVGHSLGAFVATFFGARHACRGIINIEQRLELSPIVAAIRPLEPALKGVGFPEVLAAIKSTFGIGRLPEDTRELAETCWRPDQQTVLGYWDILFGHSIDELDAIMTGALQSIAAPYLVIHGSSPDPFYRAWLSDRLRDVRVVDYGASGHFVHLEDVDAFSSLVHQFVATRCS